ncbi:glycosyltransferase, partial [Candidatus Riflebacteria bacterium]
VSVVYLKNLRRSIGTFDFLAFIEILLLFFKEKPDIIDTHASKAGFLGRLAGLLYKFFGNYSVRQIHTFHGHTFSGYFNRAKSGLFLFLEKLLTRFATDKIIVVSEQQRHDLLEKYCLGSKKKFQVVPLGIELNKKRSRKGEFRKSFGLAHNTVLVAQIGRLTQIKNPEMFIEAVHEVLKRKPFLSAHFFIIGDGEKKEDLEERVRELKLEKRITFTGFIEDMEKVYPDLDVLALTSKNEGTPMTIIESMYHETAIISTEVGGIPDLLFRRWKKKKGQWTLANSRHPRGVLVKSMDPVEFSLKLEELIENQDLRKTFGKRGKEFVQRYHSKKRLLRDMEEIYRSMVLETGFN